MNNINVESVKVFHISELRKSTPTKLTSVRRSCLVDHFSNPTFQNKEVQLTYF
jgi:hypothetical protein